MVALDYFVQQRERSYISQKNKDRLQESQQYGRAESLLPWGSRLKDIHTRSSSSQAEGKISIDKSMWPRCFVVAINAFETLQAAGLKTMWVEFGQGQSITWFLIHDLVKDLDPEKSSGMLFFHAFTGCDVVSYFWGKGKLTAWPTWGVCPEVSSLFRKLSKYSPTITDGVLDILEKFVVTMYDKHSNTNKVDKARLQLFAKKQRSFDSIPPTSASLGQHVKEPAFQAACIWGQATESTMQPERPADRGWQKNGQVWEVIWSTPPPHPKLSHVSSWQSDTAPVNVEDYANATASPWDAHNSAAAYAESDASNQYAHEKADSEPSCTYMTCRLVTLLHFFT